VKISFNLLLEKAKELLNSLLKILGKGFGGGYLRGHLG
jgi:hypothetical protein